MNTKKKYIIGVTLVSLLSAYIIIDSIYIAQTTGILVVNSKNPSATITVSQLNHQSANVGTGNARVRLTPGTYKVIASVNKAQAAQSITISKRGTSVVSLSPTSAGAIGQLPKKVVDSNALTQLLPYTGPSSEYKVSYTYEITGSSAQATIVITSPTEKGQQDALSWISKVGFTPSNLNIKYETTSVR